MKHKEVKRGDIYYVFPGAAIGSEQRGARPMLILQNDTGNKFSPTVIAASITSREKKNLPTHVPIFISTLSKNSIILLEQIRTIDKRRLCKYIGRLSNKQMKKVDDALAVSVGMSYLKK